MAKITIDIDSIKEALINIGYEISDFIERENNGKNWQLKFNNSGAVVTVYDTNTKKNTVVNGKCEEGEGEVLKAIVDSIKCKELAIDPINSIIVELINSKQEKSYYDFKKQWQEEKKDGDLLHDILCLANNTEAKDAFLIVGVTDNGEVVGVKNWRKSNEIIDFLKSKQFAGENMPDVELKKVYYRHYKLDVLMIKCSNKVPFFLSANYKDVGIQIYTRVGDTNTPKNKTASYRDVESLWRRHFEKSEVE